VIRTIDFTTGKVSTRAGYEGHPDEVDGAAAKARFLAPFAITSDADSNLYIADMDGHTIRKITAAGVVSTVAGVARQKGIVLGNLPGGLSSPRGLHFIGTKTLVLTTDNLVLKLILP
jgi:hypothetical protein